MKDYTIKVFGKEGCDKCKVLNKRLDKILSDSKWQQFDKVYYDVMTVDGLVHFAEAEFLNPQRIPAFIVCKSTDDGYHKKMAQKFQEGMDEKSGKYMFPSFIGLQTDYTNGGVISPKDITSVLDEALAS